MMQKYIDSWYAVMSGPTEWWWVVLRVALLVAAVAAYFMPTFVAIGKKNAVVILVLNLVFGWSPPASIVLLVWALRAEKVEKVAEEEGAAPKDACPHCGKESPAGAYYCTACKREMYPEMAG